MIDTMENRDESDNEEVTIIETYADTVIEPTPGESNYSNAILNKNLLRPKDLDMTKRKIPHEQRRSRNVLTKYELTRIKGVRLAQLKRGAPSKIKGSQGMPKEKLVLREVIENKIPFIIRRHMPDNLYEDWKLHELRKEDRKSVV